MATVAAFFLQQDFDVATQHFLPLAHFFFFFLPLSAKAMPVTKKAAVASNNTFFITLVYFMFTKSINVKIVPKLLKEPAQLLKFDERLQRGNDGNAPFNGLV